MLVRDPEHGQPMFFVRTRDGCIHGVFEGQEELDDDWYEHPLRLDEYSRPRVNLKSVRDPESKDTLLEQFEGAAIPVNECYIINVHPDKWPVDGKKIDCRWQDIEERFELEK